MAWSAGFVFSYVGGGGMVEGNSPPAAEMAAETSCAAASILRLRLNCTVICVEPSEFTELICEIPAIVENGRSRGVATVDAMVSGLAPGNPALTEMVGQSTLGRAATGSARNATTPNRMMLKHTSTVMIGRSMKSWERFIAAPLLVWGPPPRARAPRG